MADITMCGGAECPLRFTCYRFKAEPNEYRQSFFKTPPYKKEEMHCEFYWKLS